MWKTFFLIPSVNKPQWQPRNQDASVVPNFFFFFFCHVWNQVLVYLDKQVVEHFSLWWSTSVLQKHNFSWWNLFPRSFTKEKYILFYFFPPSISHMKKYVWFRFRFRAFSRRFCYKKETTTCHHQKYPSKNGNNRNNFQALIMWKHLVFCPEIFLFSWFFFSFRLV